MGRGLVLQLAFYDYPPNSYSSRSSRSLRSLFSRAPALYRIVVAVRDLGFVVVDLVIYFLSSQDVLSSPFVRLMTFRHGDAWRHSTS